jgi:hypothetical protein
MSAPKMIITGAEPGRDYSVVNYYEEFGFKTGVKSADISISVNLDLVGYGDFSEYLNGSSIDAHKLLEDIFTGKIPIQAK